MKTDIVGMRGVHAHGVRRRYTAMGASRPRITKIGDLYKHVYEFNLSQTHPAFCKSACYMKHSLDD